jgi:hypothetical protein
LAEQKKQEMMAQQSQVNDKMGATEAGKPKAGKEKSNPMSAASPLKTEINSDNQK